MMMQLLIPVAILGVMGLVFGAGLAIASKVFEVKTDERVPLVRDALPGANCGGCGLPGCDALASAIVKGEAPLNACPVGGNAVALAIGEIMGESVGNSAPLVACVHCGGDCTHSPNRANYYGVKDCREAMIASGGVKQCRYGCMGLGTCVNACMFDALTIGENGLPTVDVDKCTACGKCRDGCPKNLIDLIPADQLIHVDCSNTDKGKLVRAVCDIGCIACKACIKVCPADAIIVENNVASINYEKCTQCKACFEKCPTGAITLEERIVVNDETTVLELEPEKDLNEEMEAIIQVDAEPIVKVDIHEEIEILDNGEKQNNQAETAVPKSEDAKAATDDGKVEIKISDL